MDHNRSFRQTFVYPAVILPLDEKGGADMSQIDLGMFYINPASWTESKTVHWAKHEVPGFSDPHQQWISGGVRQITFEALVTKDTMNDFRNKKENSIQLPLKEQIKSVIKKKVVSTVGGIAASVFRIPSLSLTSQVNNSTNNSKIDFDIDISSKLAYYRSFLYPRMTGQTVTAPPPRLTLICGATFGERSKDTTFVLDKLDIKITKQLANLTPSEAIVTFTLTEFPGRNISHEETIKDS